MPARRAALSLLFLALAAPACKKDYPNPFENPNRTQPPLPNHRISFTSNAYATEANAPRDVFSSGPAGEGIERLTNCNSGARACDSVAAAIHPDRQRAAVRRATQDKNGDGQVTEEDGAALLLVDLARQVEAPLLTPDWNVQGIDWTPNGTTLLFSAVSPVGLNEDLYRMDPNGQNQASLTFTPNVLELSPRVDPTGTAAVFSRIDDAAAGKAEIWIFIATDRQLQVTSGGPGSERLSGTPYVVGSDANPDYSPDGRRIVFRRLTAVGDGRGQWDLLSVAVNGSDLQTLVSGPAYRGAPDWGVDGILYEESQAGRPTELIAIQPDGSGRRVVAAVNAGQRLSEPRWLAVPN